MCRTGSSNAVPAETVTRISVVTNQTSTYVPESIPEPRKIETGPHLIRHGSLIASTGGYRALIARRLDVQTRVCSSDFWTVFIGYNYYFRDPCLMAVSSRSSWTSIVFSSNRALYRRRYERPVVIC